jgi:hypothetical protein
MRGSVGPSAASDYAVIAIASRSGASVTRIAVIPVIPAIFRPIPNIAVDVVKTLGIGTEPVDAHGRLPPLVLRTVVAFVVGLVRRDR